MHLTFTISNHKRCLSPRMKKPKRDGRGVITFPELMATGVMITSIQFGNMVAVTDLVGGGGEGNKRVP